jgi:hypothetical protein
MKRPNQIQNETIVTQYSHLDILADVTCLEWFRNKHLTRMRAGELKVSGAISLPALPFAAFRALDTSRNSRQSTSVAVNSPSAAPPSCTHRTRRGKWLLETGSESPAVGSLSLRCHQGAGARGRGRRRWELNGPKTARGSTSSNLKGSDIYAQNTEF